MKDLKNYYGTSSDSDILEHYGTKRHSGRYPWGSGDNPYQHSGDFLSRVETLKKKGMSENEILDQINSTLPKEYQLGLTEFRVARRKAIHERKASEYEKIAALKEQGLGWKAIGEKLGMSESSVRSKYAGTADKKAQRAENIADTLKKEVDKKGMIDISEGANLVMGVSQSELDDAAYTLEAEYGYKRYGVGIRQPTNIRQQTNITVLAKPEFDQKYAYQHQDQIDSLGDYHSDDGGDTFKKLQRPASLDSSRVAIRYGDEGGLDKDGVMEIRRGVPDLDLGKSHYAQVRILVDGTHYLKGMAVYSDDLPDGVDVVFNTNKKKGTPTQDVLKKIKDDPDNPFGSAIKERGGQSYYDDPNGKYTDPVTGKKQSLSLINKRAEEGDWGEWADKLPSQFLSKQPKYLVDKQLNLAISDKMAEFDEICSLTNPTVKKSLLSSFADSCDYDAVHLQAAALPRQKYQVILPITSMKDNEVYAPNYKNGETVALVRYPHGGTFEIPILTVNNKQAEARRVLGNTPKDAIGINSKVAERLSGADFDGDTVMVIPCNSGRSKVKITSTPQLIKDFDPKLEYGGKKEGTFKQMRDTQKEMGVISNLITDMTIKGATREELARAVRHSMVVIDAEKHKLDYKQSEIDNGISSLKKKYQGTVEDGRYHEGASTLISRAKSEVSVVKRQGSPKIDEKTGELVWKPVDDPVYVDKRTGRTKVRTQPSTKMAETKDAYTLVSDVDSPIERAYANYANKMKAMANQARLEMLSTGKVPYSASAKETYQAEVDSLTAKLNVALKNAPRERQAQTMANAVVAAKKQDNPGMTSGEIKKASQQALTQARSAVGAKKETIKITDREWEAIQAGAISENRLRQIIDNADIDVLRQRATPRASTTLSTAKMQKITSMNASGYSTSEIAEALGISTSTVSNYLK